MVAAKSIAVVGASRHRRKFGNKCVRAYRDAGWQVVPVNPNASEIEGLPAQPSVEALAEGMDRVSVYLQPPVTLRLLESLAAKRPRELWFNPGAADDAVLREATRLGLPVVDACSIVDIGKSPADYP